MTSANEARHFCAFYPGVAIDQRARIVNVCGDERDAQSHNEFVAPAIHNVLRVWTHPLNAVGTRGFMQLAPTVKASLGCLALHERALLNEDTVAGTFVMKMHWVGHMESQLHTHNRAETTVDHFECAHSVNCFSTQNVDSHNHLWAHHQDRIRCLRSSYSTS